MGKIPTLKCDLKVWGPPGTGKTYTTTDEVAKRANYADEVVAVTYRSDLAEDLTTSLEKRGVKPSKNGVDWPFVGTIHAIAKRALGYTTENNANPEKFFQKHGIKYEGRNPDTEEGNTRGFELGDQLMCAKSWMDNAKEHDISKYPGLNDLEELCDPIETYNWFIDKWGAWKENKGLWDFDDLLIDAINKDVPPPADIMLVDEAQDNSPLAHSLLAKWSEETRFCIVGADGNQAIYSFMGANPDTFWEHTEGETVNLDHCYRVPKNTWEVAERVLEVSNHPVPDLTFKKKKGAYGSIRWSDLNAELKMHTNPHKETFHLVRTNWQKSLIAKKLIQNGIPFTGHGSRWRKSDVNLLNAAIKTRHLQHNISTKISKKEAKEIIKVFPSKILPVTKKTFTNNPVPVNDNNLYDVFGQRVCSILMNKSPFNKAIDSRMSSTRKKRLHPAIERVKKPLDKPKHEIATIHSSKGRGKDIVYLYDGITSKIKDSIKDISNQPEEARVWFVALTRHKDKLIIVEPAPGVSAISTSPFILLDN